MVGKPQKMKFELQKIVSTQQHFLFFFLAPFTNSRRRQSLDQHPFFQKFNIYLHFEKNQTPLPRRKLHELNERIYLNELDEEIKVNQILFRIQTEINWKAFIFGRLNEIMNLIMPHC